MSIKKTLIKKTQDIYFSRYSIYDKLIMRLLIFIGEDNVVKLQDSRFIRKVHFLHFINSLLFIKIKKTNDNVGMVPFHLFNKVKSRYIHYSIADWLLRHRNYSNITEKHFISAHYRNKEITINLRYSDFISQKYGYKSERLKRIISRLCSDVSLRNLNKGQKLRLAIMLYQKNKDAKANEIIKQIGKRFLLKYTSSPYVFNKIKKNKIFNDPYIQRGSEQYSHILKSRNEFIKLIRNSAGSFCIVGNAPTEINTGHGALIDSKKIVIRINNYTLDYPDDYGTKQDIWVRVANKEVSNKNLKNNRLVIFAANNFTIKRRDANKYFLAPQLLEMEYTVIPNHVYKSLIKKLDGLPSTGLAVAYWVYSIVGKIPKECLFGFTHSHNNKDFHTHYFVDENEVGTHLHEWDKERMIFEQITK
ncbi:glycosyltransferase family 29 protein [Escherichia coli]|uniref:glycosyltransferase family 29 protein n=1 Tax=Escherichia coli TaxID=562 RepID=UPI00141A508E|nr:glycosyltransferase family 29 protein [Escherichia coli]KAF3709710.1 hypothetical protein FM738_000767 [Escherichia coli]